MSIRKRVSKKELERKQWDRQMDQWRSMPAPRRSNEPPQLTPAEVRIVEQRIANWSRKNF